MATTDRIDCPYCKQEVEPQIAEDDFGGWMSFCPNPDCRMLLDGEEAPEEPED